MTKEYLLKLMERCQEYAGFSTYLGTFEDVPDVRLQDVYTAPNILEFGDARVLLRPYTEDLIRKQISHTLSVMNTEKDTVHEMVQHKVSDMKVARETAQVSGPPVKYKKIVYASEGGGKTGFAEMYTLLCAYKVLGKETEEDRSLERFLVSHNAASGIFEINETAVPVLMHAGDFFLAIEDGMPEFEEVLIDVVMRVLGDEVRTRAEIICKTNTIALIIDDADYLPDGYLEEFIRSLEAYLDKNQNRVPVVVLTASNPVNCVLDELMEDMKVERYVLPELQYGSVDWVIEFARRWYTAFNNISERKLDVEKNFLLPFSRNAEVLSRISTPKELTDILFISLFDSCIPSGVVSVTRRLFEIKMKKARQDEGKIVPKLAEVAYEMLESGKDYITERSLKRCLAGQDEELQAYAFDLSPDPEEAMDFAIDAFEDRLHVNADIDSLSTWGVIEEEYDSRYEWNMTGEDLMLCYDTDCMKYKFVSEDEKAYCAAYAIKYNLVKREGRKKRFDYIRDKIVLKDEAWRKTIVSLAVIDAKLQEEVIRMLLELAEKTESDSYYASLLLELVINPEVDFLTAEKGRLFKILVRPCNRGLIAKENSKIDRMLLTNSSKENVLFAKALLEAGL